MIILSLILSGLWRSWYGMEKSFPPKAVVKFVGIALAAGVGYVGIGLPYGPVLGLLTAASMIMAVSKFIKAGWGSWLMAFRYSLPALAIVAPSWFGVYDVSYYGLHYVALCVIGGLIYPLTIKLWPQKSTARAVEFAVGALVIGGLALL